MQFDAEHISELLLPLPSLQLPWVAEHMWVLTLNMFSPRQQNPRNPRARKMTAHTPAHTSVKFQLLLDLVAVCCQSAWRGQEWLTVEKNEGHRDVGTFWGGIKWYSKYKRARRPSRTNENPKLKTKKNDCRQKGAQMCMKLKIPTKPITESKPMKPKWWESLLWSHVSRQFCRPGMTVIGGALVEERDSHYRWAWRGITAHSSAFTEVEGGMGSLGSAWPVS